MTDKIKAIVVWVARDLYGGVPAEFVRVARELNVNTVMLKVGNGQVPWEGLRLIVEKLQAAGFKVRGWWYYYGLALEGQISAKHALDLGLDGLDMDVEGHYDGSELFNSRLVAKSKRMMGEIRNVAPDLSLALASWWLPSVHKPDAYAPILEQCEYNMPQMYPIGRYSEEGAARLVDQSIDEYSQLYSFPAVRTAPMLAAFGQTWGKNKTWWEITVPQMDAMVQKAKTFDCAGASWYSLDYIEGESGNPSRKAKPHHRAAIAGYSFGEAVPPDPPDPDPDPDIADQLRSSSARLTAEANHIDDLADEIGD